MDHSSPTPADEPSPSLGSALFGFRGRTGRGRYWIGIVLVVGFLFLTMTFFAIAMNPTGGGEGLEVLAFPAFFAAVWVHAAVTIKRLRDMGWSAWLYLGVVAVLVGSIYVGDAAEAASGLSLPFVILVLALPGVARPRTPEAQSPAA